MAVTQTEFRAALRLFAAGVTVVTSRDEDGQACGMTASAFASVSLEPPLILVCVDHAATAHPALARHGWFAVNVLRRDQEYLSRQFAASGGDKFAGVAFREGLVGLPVLEDVLTVLECRVTSCHEAGDHTIFVGRVERVTSAGGPPLIYFQGTYHHLATNGDTA